MIVRQDKKGTAVKITLLGMALLWFSGIVLPALIYFQPGIAILLPFLKITYSHVCHQIPQKCMSVNGFELLVCSRCFGIYTGILLASVISLFHFLQIKQKTKLFFLSAAPMLIDVICTTTGIYGYNKIFAFITGVIFGSIVFAYILNIIFENF